jgi:hypothetical protein
LSIDDERAREFENLIGQSIDIISKMNNPRDDFFEGRRRNALLSLQNDSAKHLKGYWDNSAKIEKISEFSRARNNANLMLSSILASFKV